MIVAIFLLLALTAAVYSRIAGHEFIDYDDDAYIFENPMVRAGLSWAGARWAFTTGYAFNYHPLTWLSHMLDVELFGVTAGPHLVVNLTIHLINVSLLLWVLHKMTGAFWRSFAVAALFALHPINIQSVAWLAERKNVLSTTFWFLTMGTYHTYVLRPSIGRLILPLTTFALGMLTKPMLVTLPFVLLLLDYWPLGRTDRRRAIVEKWPFMLLTAACAGATYWVQSTADRINPAFLDRLGNALVSYATYLRFMVWPFGFALEYPWHPVAPASAIFSALLLIALTVLCVRLRARAPYLPVGWCWFLGTLVPVIGFVQVGRQAMADRYAYVTLIGMFVAVVWGAFDLATWLGRDRRGYVHALAGMGIVSGLLLAVRTRAELSYWHDGLSIFRRAVELTEDNRNMQYNLGVALSGRQRTDEAIDAYIAVMKMDPEYGPARHNARTALFEKGRNEAQNPSHSGRGFMQSIRLLLDALPNDSRARIEVGEVMQALGRPDEARPFFEEAIRMMEAEVERDPKAKRVHAPDWLRSLAEAYEGVGRIDDALRTAKRLRARAKKMHRPDMTAEAERIIARLSTASE